jgi:geranylgeranyl pyrophosphate synthase
MNLQEFKSAVEALPLKVEGVTTSDLTKELNALVKAGGKKFRPGLLFLMGHVLGLKIEDLYPYARSVELTHLASLIHDDVIDESDTRRNHRTLNALRDNTTAILAGDYVLASVMAELARTNRNDILTDLTTAIKDLADGEWLQYDLKKKSDVSFADLELISLRKTGSLIRWCCSTPAKLAQHPDVPKLSVMGEKIGLIFQMADDIVDSLHSAGKPAFQDIANGQINFVTLKLIDLYPELKSEIYSIKGKALSKIPWTESQYKQAILAVDHMITKEKTKVLQIFTSLCESTGKTEMIDLFDMMIGRIQANYSEAL